MNNKPDPARSLAAKALERINQQAGYATRLWPTMLARSSCDERQRSFATELLYGTLRLQPILIARLQAHLRQPFAKLPPPVQALLLLGSYQLSYTSVPAYSAVHTSVQLLPKAFQGLKGLVNGVLRNLARSQEQVAAEQQGGQQGESSALATEQVTSQATPGWPPTHLDWLNQELLEQLGPEQTQHWWQSQLERPQLTVRIEGQRIEPKQLVATWRQAGIDVSPHPHIPELWHVKLGAALQQLPGFQEGLCTVQDGGAYLIGQLCPALPQDAIVLDVCAAPGGKIFHLASMLPKTSRLIAMDCHAGRMASMQHAGKRLQHEHIAYHLHDATMPLTPAQRQAWFGSQGVDLLICDAPCSGFGTLRRHPESSKRDKPDVERLATLQQQILSNCSQWLRPGGYLIYSVCTITKAEGAQQMEQFIQAHPEFRLLPAAVDPCQPSVDGLLRTWTHRYQTDSFCAALLQFQPKATVAMAA